MKTPFLQFQLLKTSNFDEVYFQFMAPSNHCKQHQYLKTNPSENTRFQSTDFKICNFEFWMLTTSIFWKYWLLFLPRLILTLTPAEAELGPAQPQLVFRRFLMTDWYVRSVGHHRRNWTWHFCANN